MFEIARVLQRLWWYSEWGGVVFQNERSVLRRELSYIALDEKLGTIQCHDIELLQKEGKYLRWRCGVGPLDQGKQF